MAEPPPCPLTPPCPTPALCLTKHGNDEGAFLAWLAGPVEPTLEALSQNCVDVKGNPLVYSASRGWLAATWRLLQRGVPIDLRCGDGSTALHNASQTGKDAVVSLLLAKNANVMARNHQRTTPIHAAARSGNAEPIRLLLAAKANVLSLDGANDSAFRVAISNERMEAAAVLLKAKADVHEKHPAKTTLLHHAAELGSLHLVKLLLHAKADVDGAGGRAQRGDTPLMAATRKGRADIVSLLLAQRADPKQARSDTGRCALFMAAELGRVESAALLLRARAFVDQKSRDIDATPLYMAAQNGNVILAELLLVHRAAINALTRQGNTPLFVASFTGRNAAVRLLIAARADLQKRNVHNQDAVLVAVRQGHCGITRMLLTALAPSVPCPAFATLGSELARLAERTGHGMLGKWLSAMRGGNSFLHAVEMRATQHVRHLLRSERLASMIDRRALLNQPFSQPHSPHSQQQQHQAEMGAAEGEVAVVCALSAIQLASADDTLLGPMALAISQELVSLVGNACQAFDPATNAVDWPLSFKLGARALLLSGRRLGTKPAFLHRPEAQVDSEVWLYILSFCGWGWFQEEFDWRARLNPTS